ncbi:MAG: hypothetical protein D6816_02455 [Bacteroidetes bacterium]|nr:MAG: hypothetical protein D6816_02455 [Bacteroidota bacterium]
MLSPAVPNTNEDIRTVTIDIDDFTVDFCTRLLNNDEVILFDDDNTMVGINLSEIVRTATQALLDLAA